MEQKYTTTTYVSEKATVIVHKPILTEEEYNKRREAFLEECDNLMREYYALKDKEAKEKPSKDDIA